MKESPLKDYEADLDQHLVQVLKPRQWAFVPVWWSNWCGRHPARPAFDAQITVRLGQQRVGVTLHHPSLLGVPRCDSPIHASALEVGRFYTPLPDGWRP